MIERNEKLLPGNIVAYGGKPICLSKHDIYGILQLGSKFHSPISLIPEILTGWCLLEEVKSLSKIVREWKIYPELFLRLYKDKWYLIYCGCNIKLKTTKPSLHLIQNATFFITGEELKIKLPK